MFHIVLDEKAAGLATPLVFPKQSGRSPALQFAAVAFALFLAITGFAWWQFRAPEFEPLAAAEMARHLPEKPSIAVLAFSDLSQGADKGYLSDAISEEIISKLSRFSEFL